jgi:OOP family OmpA-OmpF porin
VKKFFSANWFARGDYKLVRITETNTWDNAVNLGIGYAFGGKPARPVAAAPAPAPAPQPAPEADTDGDGVVDSRDRCANTPRELAVDANGCPILETQQMSQQLLVNFDVDKSEIKPEFNDEIAEFAQFMTTYTNTSVVIEGHTDSDGSDAYNQALSERRAQAVMTHLVRNHNIAASRLSAVGYGEGRPLANNNSAASKASNRRIMAEVSVEVQEERRR